MTAMVRPVSAALGAEVTGIDLSEPLTGNLFGIIDSAFQEHKVLVFPDQDLTPQEHVTFSRHFGDLETHVLTNNLIDGIPEVYIIANVVDDKGEYIGRPRAGMYWHTDLSYQEIPSLGSIMYAHEIPPVGGDTMFADLEKAYDALSETMKGLIADLRTVHDFRWAYERNSRRVKNFAEISEEQLAARPAVEHPLVRTHPVTGNTSLYVSPGFTSHIVGLTAEESEALLGMLNRHASRPEFVYRHDWSVHDVVIWDNRSTMHHAVDDYDDSSRRLMHRTTITGERPFRAPPRRRTTT
jgi:taurine dioxygenase